MERELTWPDAPGAGVLRIPDGAVRGGLVALHGSSDGRARQPLFEHLGRALAPSGVAVLSYDRRRSGLEEDTPFFVQAEDAVRAMTALRTELDVPVGVFGFSQGAWAAALAGAEEVTSYVVLLGCSGVSPAEQMRFHMDDVMRRVGFDDAEREQALALRRQAEEYLRGGLDRDTVAAALHEADGQPWFARSFLPTELPDRDAWSDMDFDPAPSFGEVQAPVLAMWGADEECVPRGRSQQVWDESGADVTVVDLPGCGHWPVVGSSDPDYAGWDEDEITPDLDRAVVAFLDRVLG